MTTHNAGGNKQPRSMRLGYAAIAVIVLGIFAAACTNGERSEPVAAADAAVSVTFDGETCSWEGPTLIEQGTVDISLTNSTDLDFMFAGFLMQEPALSQELERTPIGTDMEVVTQRTAFPDGEMAFAWWISPGEPVNRDQLLPAGVYLLDCLTGGPFDHVWRTAQIEVVATAPTTISPPTTTTEATACDTFKAQLVAISNELAIQNDSAQATLFGWFPADMNNATADATADALFLASDQMTQLARSLADLGTPPSDLEYSAELLKHAIERIADGTLLASRGVRDNDVALIEEATTLMGDNVILLDESRTARVCP